MARALAGPCSPYLIQRRRSLRVACHQITMTHAIAALPCTTCELHELCARKAAPNPTSVPRLTYTGSVPRLTYTGSFTGSLTIPQSMCPL